MTAANVSRLGQINQAGDEKALYLKVFAGEVLTAFETANMMMEKHTVRSIDNGKSAQFPVTGKIGAEYHTPGNEILGLKVNHAEKVITIDDLLISHAFVANIDEAMNHYDVRSIYSTEMGRKLGNAMDANVMAEVVKAARSAATVTDGYAGTILKNDKFKQSAEVGASTDVQTKAKALAEALFAAAQALDEKDVPDTGRWAAFRPVDYYALAQNTDLINKLWGGNGAYSDGKIFRVAGIDIVKANQLPKTNTTSTNTFHGVDATKTVGIVWTKDAVGTVKLLDLAMESDYQVERQGTLLVAKYAVGHGVLRPECAVELQLDTLVNA
jgi:hypothetical protein